MYMALRGLPEMELDHWDQTRQKFVLYRTAERHSDDCARFPFESISYQVFLDANIINVLVKHCAYIFDRQHIPATIEPTLATDIEALMHVFYVSSRASWDILEPV
jgi:hypothetical protein